MSISSCANPKYNTPAFSTPFPCRFVRHARPWTDDVSKSIRPCTLPLLPQTDRGFPPASWPFLGSCLTLRQRVGLGSSKLWFQAHFESSSRHADAWVDHLLGSAILAGNHCYNLSSRTAAFEVVNDLGEIVNVASSVCAWCNYKVGRHKLLLPRCFDAMPFPTTQSWRQEKVLGVENLEQTMMGKWRGVITSIFCFLKKIPL